MVFAQFADEAVRPEAVQAAIAIAQNLGASAREDAAIFNGNDLTGWTGTGNYWRVEDGAIVGQSTEQIPDTGYLWAELEAGDFYFCAEVLLEPPTANSASSSVRKRSTRPDTPSDTRAISAEGLGPSLPTRAAAPCSTGTDAPKRPSNPANGTA